jgi:hypothetical protein
MARSVTFEVGVTFCSGRSFKHDMDDLAEAMAEYTTMLSVAIDPSLATELDAKHIRMVTFLGFDELGQVTQHITSPIFECEDRATA